MGRRRHGVTKSQHHTYTPRNACLGNEVVQGKHIPLIYLTFVHEFSAFFLFFLCLWASATCRLVYY